MDYINKLKTKWDLTSNWQILLIMVAFSLAGSSVLFIREAFFSLLGFTEHTNFWLKAFTYILFIFPAYQCLLLFYGTLLGQFHFFWKKEKQMFNKLISLVK